MAFAGSGKIRLLKAKPVLCHYKGQCTAAYVTNPELFHSTKYYGDVETKGLLTEGFTMIDYEDILRKSEEEKNIDYIDSVDRDGVMKVFFEALKSY